MASAEPFADRAEPIADQRPHARSASTGASRQTATHSSGLRTLDERAKVRCANNWRRAALMRVLEVVDFQQHGAGGAQVGVEPVVPLLLGLEFLGRDVRRRRGSPDFGVSSVEALRRGREARRQVGDRPLQRDGERIALRAQALQIGVVEIARP